MNTPHHTEPPQADRDDGDAIDLDLPSDAVPGDTAADGQATYLAIEWLEGQPVPNQHQRLAQAAQRSGAKPGRLAPILTMRGFEHMLWEERSRG